MVAWDKDVLSGLNLSSEQRAAVVHEGDTVVTAGAGTGKTRVLLARYLALLTDGLPLRSIVAVTFTRKAAREMRNRIREEIRRCWQMSITEAPVWQERYAQLDAARIGTIHSLCADVLRQHPAEAQVDPDFEVLDDNLARVLKVRAVKATMRWAVDQPDVVELFPHVGVDAMPAMLRHLLDFRLEVQEAFAAMGEKPLRTWVAVLAAQVDPFLDDSEVKQAIAYFQKIQADGVLKRLSSDRLAAKISELLQRWDQVIAAREKEEWETILSTLPLLRKAADTRAGRKDNWPDISRPRGWMGVIQEAYDGGLLPWLGRGLSSDKPVSFSLDRDMAAALPSLQRLYRRGLSEYRALKEERRALDYDDLEKGTLALLTEYPSVAERWRKKVRAVLVDEFQDTNDRQRQLVEALAEPGELFVVGDAKQSIYRFRGADVTVFRRVRGHIQSRGGAHFSLGTTYRGHRELVSVLNELLEPVLGSEDDPSRPYAIPFQPLIAHRSEPKEGTRPPYLELHLGIGKSADEGREAAAKGLAARLRELRDEERVNFGDVALLFRASTSFPYYEDAFEEAGLPYVTVAGRGFYNRPEVRDALNTLRALNDPTDDLAMAGLLRSPAIGLTDAALYRLRWGDDGQARPLWEALKEVGASLPGRDGRRATRALEIVQPLHKVVGRTPVAKVLKQFLDATDYRSVLQLGGGDRARGNVEKLLSDAHQSQLVSVSAFLEYVQSLRDVAARESEAIAEAEGAVQLMTVHKAKGLEFPVVVLADAGWQRGGGSINRVLVDPQLGPLLRLERDGALPAMYRLARWHEADEEKAEKQRLLYVAATRAADKLLISGHVKVSTSRSHPGKLLTSGWLDMLADPLGLDDVQLSDKEDALPTDVELISPIRSRCSLYMPSFSFAEGVRQKGSTLTGADAPNVRVEAALPPPLLAPYEVAPRRAADEKVMRRDQPRRVWRVTPHVKHPTAPGWVVGMLVHKALRRWRFPDDDDFANFLRPLALTAGLTGEGTIRDAVNEAARLLRRFQNHPLYDEMESAKERYHEVAYSYQGSGGLENGIVDALYRDQGGWTLVEYKSDDVRGETQLRERAREYRPQVRRYVRAVENLLGQEPRTVLCFLDYKGGIRIV